MEDSSIPWFPFERRFLTYLGSIYCVVSSLDHILAVCLGGWFMSLRWKCFALLILAARVLPGSASSFATEEGVVSYQLHPMVYGQTAMFPADGTPRVPLVTPISHEIGGVLEKDAEPETALPKDRLAWWHESVGQPFRNTDMSVSLTVEDLLVRALSHSSQIRVFSELPLIRETSLIEADSAFDWHAFLDSRWDDISEPVGNTLTVGGGGTRFRDHNLNGSAGLRKRTRLGGQLEVAQRLGFQDNNSNFFIPDQQATSRIALSYTQPLMRGRGKVYNESLTVLACIDTDIAGEEFQRQLQSHLLEVVRAYWGLYLERGTFAQKARAFERAESIYQRLKRRANIDAFNSQLISAEAEMKSRRSELKRSTMAVLNAEDRIRSLVNDPSLESNDLELVPIDTPALWPSPISMEEALATAVQYRPEVNQALKQIQAACVRVNMSKNELMPVLNLVTETYVSGLRGDGRFDQSWTDQFDRGEPSYAIGLQFEIPLGNRAARARHQRRHLEVRQLRSQYETTVQTLKLETRVAVRELETSFDELDTKRTALDAMLAKTSYIQRRWELLPGEGRSGSFVLEDLLAAQSQLSRAENDYLTSLVTYNLAVMNLKRATGTLLQQEQVEIGRTCLDGLPTQLLSKPYLLEREETKSTSIVPFQTPEVEEIPVAPRELPQPPSPQ